MTDLRLFKKRIEPRLAELDTRVHEVDHELAESMSADLNEQAIDIEDDEVLEGLGITAQNEIALLTLALSRIEDGSYGICQSCENPISQARLNAVLYAPLCRDCARGR